jgi:hypothetical protein
VIDLIFSSLLLLGAPTPPSAAVWRFPDRYGPELRDAIVALRGTGLPGHLVTDDELGAFLSAARPDTATLDCFVDQGVCADDRRAALSALAFTSRLDATAERTAAGAYRVSFTQISAGDAPPQTFSGEGADLNAAVRVALTGLQGQGSVEVAVQPADAKLLLDGQPWGSGSGTLLATPGKHTLRAEAPGRRPVETPIEVVRGRTVSVTVDLPIAYGRLLLTIKTANATVTLDGQPYDPAEAKELPPGEHIVEVSAPGHVTYRHPIEVKPSTQLDIKIGLVPEGTDWNKAFSAPHQSTLRHTYLARGGLRMMGLGSGNTGFSRGTGAERVALDKTESLSMVGVELGVTWRDRYLICDALTISYVGGGSADATFEDGKGTVEGSSRVELRPGWFGVRYPVWRLEPYATGGPLLAFDSFEAVAPTGSKETFDSTSFQLGLQVGVRLQLTPEWFVHTAFDTTFWFNERASGAFMIGGGHAFDFDLPEWL